MNKMIIALMGFTLMMACASAPQSSSTPAADPAELTAGDITITVSDLDASTVNLAGSFNGWSTDADAFTLDGDLWTITKTLSGGAYEFKLVIDGEWVTPDENINIDPVPSDFKDDGFGGLNAVYKIR